MLRAACLGLCALSAAASGQVSETWSLTVDQSNYTDWIADAIVEPDGTTTYVGGLKLADDGFPDPLAPTNGAIARVDPQGALLWLVELAPVPYARTIFQDVEIGPTGNLFTTGTAQATIPGTVGGAVTAAYSPAGLLLWSTLVDGGAVDLAIDPSGDVWVVGARTTAGSGSDILVQRITSTGSVLFTRVWNGPANLNDAGYGIAPDGSGGAYVTGSANQWTSGNAVLLRFDAAGNMLWARTSNPGYGSVGLEVAVDATGHAYVAGAVANSVSLLMKYDSAGNFQWQSLHAITGWWRCVAVDPRGDVISAGHYTVQKHDALGNLLWSSSGDGPWIYAMTLDAAGEIAVTGRRGSAAAVARIDRDGSRLWVRDFGGTGGANAGTGVGFGPAGTVFAAAQTGSNAHNADHDVVVVRFDEAIVPFCFGDGSGTGCPCGNVTPSHERAGCASSLGHGGRLTVIGVPSLAADTLVLRGSAMPDASALYFQGTTQVGAGAGAAFGDGLRCAGGTIVRLKTVVNAAGASQFPAAGDPSVSVRGQIGAPGTRAYQVWYRNAAAFCTNDTFNLTNGVLVSWSN